MHDESYETLTKWEAYYGDDPVIIGYSGSLGLRNQIGTTSLHGFRWMNRRSPEVGENN